jgi:hypothetical protein
MVLSKHPRETGRVDDDGFLERVLRFDDEAFFRRYGSWDSMPRAWLARAASPDRVV